MKADAKKTESIPFEKAIERLESIVEMMESGDTDLDEMVKLFEEGRKLVGVCNEKLAGIERKVEMLTKGEGGQIEAKPFDENSADSNAPF